MHAGLDCYRRLCVVRSEAVFEASLTLAEETPMRSGFIALVMLALALPLSAQCVPGFNRCLEFDGVDDQVRISVGPDGFSDFTIELWVKGVSQGGFRALITKWGNGSPFWLGTINDLPIIYINGASIATGATPILDGDWHHLAVTRFGSDVTLFVDGVADATGNYGTTMVTNGLPMTVGVRSDNEVEDFTGRLDEIRMWSVGRSQSVIQSSMNSGLSGTEIGLELNWRFDTGLGQNAVDISPNGNNGTLGSFAGAEADRDPIWVGDDGAPITYCGGGSGTGQANGPLNSLVVDGVGATGVGPFPITLGSTLTLDWMGPPNQGLLLLTGPLNPGATTVPGLGSVDLGTPPNFQDIGVIFDGTVGAGSIFYRTDAMGLATQTFTLPPLPPGLLVPVQGLVIQAPGTSAFGSLFTAAFTLSS